MHTRLLETMLTSTRRWAVSAVRSTLRLHTRQEMRRILANPSTRSFKTETRLDQFEPFWEPFQPHVHTTGDLPCNTNTACPGYARASPPDIPCSTIHRHNPGDRAWLLLLPYRLRASWGSEDCLAVSDSSRNRRPMYHIHFPTSVWVPGNTGSVVLEDDLHGVFPNRFPTISSCSHC